MEIEETCWCRDGDLGFSRMAFILPVLDDGFLAHDLPAKYFLALLIPQNVYNLGPSRASSGGCQCMHLVTGRPQPDGERSGHNSGNTRKTCG